MTGTRYGKCGKVKAVTKGVLNWLQEEKEKNKIKWCEREV
jgi:hypothetical protein